VLALQPLAPDIAPLDAGEQFALDLLLDLSCVLRVDGAATSDVVQLHIVPGGRPTADVTLLGLRHRPRIANGPSLVREVPVRTWLGVGDGLVTVGRDVLRAICNVAGGVREQRSTARDRYQRVPSVESGLVATGGDTERNPLVSAGARALADAVAQAAGRRPCFQVAPWPQGKRWAAALTHDLDVVDWWPAFTTLRVAELTRKGQLGQAMAVIAAAARSGGRDVVWRGVQSVLQAEAQHGVRSTWFILCGTPTLATARAGDLTYRPDGNLARRILGAVGAAGHELGLHGSFATSERPEVFAEQRARLATLTGTEVSGVRQHYLRMHPATTPAQMAAAGFAYDSTIGFADRNGFRLATPDVLPSWSDARQAALPLDEVPFCWMDRALSKYRGVEEPDAWIEDALALADACRVVQGLFVGIWHPNLTPALGFPGAPAAYARLVGELVQRGAHLAPLAELVAWRRVRRTVRAEGVGPDGRPVLRNARAGVVIESLPPRSAHTRG